MRPIKSIFVLFLFLFAVNVYSTDSFEFDPQSHTAQIETTHIWFADNGSNDKTGPELYADETDANFFTLVKNIINNTVANGNKIVFLYSTTESQNHGQYKCIIPDF